MYRVDYFIVLFRIYANGHGENPDGREGGPILQISFECGHRPAELIGDPRRILCGGTGTARVLRKARAGEEIS